MQVPMKQLGNILHVLFYNLWFLFTIPSFYYFHAALSYRESFSNFNNYFYLELV